MRHSVDEAKAAPTGIVELSGLTAAVVGTSPNIGVAIALGLAEAGAGVACVDRNADNAHRSAEYLISRGHMAQGVACDVTDEDDVERALDLAEDELGSLDILVNAAAFYNPKGLLEMPVQEWRRQIDVILTGAFLATKAVARRMVSSGREGSVVNVISTAGHQGQPGNIGYSTAKAGLRNFTRAAAMDLAQHNIRVNSLTPTATDPRPGWEMATAWSRDVNQELGPTYVRRAQQLPLGRMPVPRDYASAIVFLASSAAGSITGADLVVDAGALAKYWAWDPAAER